MKDSANLHPSSSRIYTTKRNYNIHYHNLKLHLELELRLTNVHRVLSFDQSPWLKNYINFNTRQRTAAKHYFEKDFFKLMNNAVFGKSFLLICSFMILYIDSFIVAKVFIFMFICSYVLIHLLQVNFYFYDYLFLCIDSFIVGTAFIFIFICSYVLIHSFIHCK